MTTIQRLTDSCVLVTTDTDATLFDPGSHTFGSGEFDLDSLGDVSRVFITHEHADHVNPGFVSWLIDRRRDVGVYSNRAVADLLAGKGIEARTDVPADVQVEDVMHEPIPTGATPPNRAFTIEGILTHPGDSRQPSTAAPVLALPLLVPWGSATDAVAFARRLSPKQVIPIHDFYLTASGREWITGLVGNVLKSDDIELVDLDWGDSYTI